MPNNNVALKIKLAWWFKWFYLPVFTFGIYFMVNYIDAEFEPNFERFDYWLKKALSVEFE